MRNPSFRKPDRKPARTLLLRVVTLSAGASLVACGGSVEELHGAAVINPDGGSADDGTPDHLVVGVVFGDGGGLDGSNCCGLVGNSPDGGDAQIINGTLPTTPDSGPPDIVIGSVVTPPDAPIACDSDAMILGDSVCAPDAGTPDVVIGVIPIPVDGG